eukprot:CAMPEP_0182940744 /NCGR_PEP_ID=MMETSP0105_2-20130417/47844_1 /TAXON_ID=81532 ORGANISM="Acanthoeca-like sp., Strain 10tr" /NCGR_SAMPLE_ID=MMETSP0105_2 /ASSEMBLY_ACC=CAM_ASM_000205 /LENGTH=65 /DNA_ID=CAMNT_0025080277 /DNA_START=119 /DNA_END=315 /DNA_ORIENTATION=+
MALDSGDHREGLDEQSAVHKVKPGPGEIDGPDYGRRLKRVQVLVDADVEDRQDAGGEVGHLGIPP